MPTAARPDTPTDAIPWLLLAGTPLLRLPGSAEAQPLAARDAALLAWLALEGPTARNRVAALLWPESDADAARNSLRQRLFKLRRQFGVALVAGQDTLALAPGVTHDLADSEGVLGSASPAASGEFARWLEAQRMLRRGRLAATLAELSDLAERARDWPDALAHATELLALEPLSEAAHRRLMRLHYLAGDRAAALLAFDALERTLKDEVSAQPSPESLQLLATVQATAAPQAGIGVPASVLHPPRLVGRDAEITRLQAAWAAGGALLLTGEGGLGKSRLLGDLAAGLPVPERVHLGARPGDAGLPFALLSRLLRALLERVPAAGLAAGVRAELARLLPELGDAPPAGSDRTRFVNAVQALLAQARAQGLRGLLIDDLHWADEASAELLLQGGTDPGLALVAAWREAELGEPARLAATALLDAGRATTLALVPLTVEQVAQLLASLDLPALAEPALAAQLHRRSGGNPMFLLETVKAMLSTGTALAPTDTAPGAPPALPRLAGLPAVNQLIARRLRQLSPAAGRLARCAAVAGQDFSAGLAARVLGIQPLDLADAWSELEAAQVLREGSFVHDLVYEAALASVPGPIARELHGQVADDMQATRAEPARIAEHWLAAGQPLRAAPALREAGARAATALRFEEAARLHARAGALLREGGDRRAAFDAWFDSAQALREITMDSRMREAAEQLEALAADDTQAALAALVRVAQLHAERNDAQALAHALHALPQVDASGLPEARGAMRAAIGGLLWERRDLAEAARHTEEGLAWLQGLDDRTTRFPVASPRHDMTHGLGLIMNATGRYPEAITHLSAAYRMALAQRDYRNAAASACSLARIGLEQGALPVAQEWSGRALDLLVPLGEGNPLGPTTWQIRGSVAAYAGELGTALDALDRASALAAQGFIRQRTIIDRTRAALWFDLGRADLAHRLFDEMAAREGLLPRERDDIEMLRLVVGAPSRARAETLLDAAVKLADFGQRAHMLALLQPLADAATMLPLLTVSASAAADRGAHGLWLRLHMRRCAALRALERDDEAFELAHQAWPRVEHGLVGFEMLPRVAAELCACFAGRDEALAHSVAERAADWMQRAAATLPEPWRESYLQRSPALNAMPSQHRIRRLLNG